MAKESKNKTESEKDEWLRKKNRNAAKNGIKKKTNPPPRGVGVKCELRSTGRSRNLVPIVFTRNESRIQDAKAVINKNIDYERLRRSIETS